MAAVDFLRAPGWVYDELMSARPCPFLLLLEEFASAAVEKHLRYKYYEYLNRSHQGIVINYLLVSVKNPWKPFGKSTSIRFCKEFFFLVEDHGK